MKQLVPGVATRILSWSLPLFWASVALAQNGAAGGDPPADTASQLDAGADPGSGDASADAAAPKAAPAHAETSCVERITEGKGRAKLSERFPRSGLSGHAATLEIEIEHGKGETVLPSGFHFQTEADTDKVLERAGFALPDPDGGAGPVIERAERAGHVTTKVRISFVPLPAEPGRQQLVLPPIPIAIAHASGALSTLCTASHAITIEDPIANEPNPNPRHNPPPRSQREEWTLAKNVAAAALIALAVGALSAFLISRWLRRPKPVPPPPPPRPPWEVALEELFDIGHAGLIAEQRFAEHYDRVSDVIRKYLGDLYGFDGLESTTRETLSMLRMVSLPTGVFSEIEIFMRHADLVKFARLTPSEAECAEALTRAQAIVKGTIPAPPPAASTEAPAEETTGETTP